MISGAHAIIYSRDADADRAFLRDVIGLPFVDVGHGWLIFGLPPSELAVHPSKSGDTHELFLMCDNVEEFAAAASDKGARLSRIDEQSWGRVTRLTLPGGGTLGVYEPKHERPRSSTDGQ